MADQEQNSRQALIALRKAVVAVLTARSHLDNIAALLNVELNEDDETELTALAHETKRIGNTLTLEDLDWFIKKVVD